MAYTFLKSASQLDQCPTDDKPEVAFVGRSNAGKSSLLNLVMGRQLAKVSQTPGKTRLLNFFDGPDYRLVDLPGYGYASRGFAEREGWRAMIESYLSCRGQLRGLVLAMDIRREWTADEDALLKWWSSLQPPSRVIVAFTKSDKLKRGQIAQAETQLDRVLGRWTPDGPRRVTTSSSERSGREQLMKLIYEDLVRRPL
jgi:GTP-binding protein